MQLQNIILLVVKIKEFIDDSCTVYKGLSNNRMGKALNTLLYCPLFRPSGSVISHLNIVFNECYYCEIYEVCG